MSVFEYRASPPAYDYTREKLWMEKMGEVCGKEFSHMMHERQRLLNVFNELLVLIRFEIEADHTKRMALQLFTGMVRDTFWREVLLGQCRFSDVPPPPPRENVRLRRKSPKDVPMSLPGWISRHTTDWPDEKRIQLEAIIKEFDARVRPIKKLRDYHLAHSDARALKAIDPRKASLEQVADAFAALDNALRTIEAHYDIEHISDLPYQSSFGGAESLVNMINQSTLEHP